MEDDVFELIKQFYPENDEVFLETKKNEVLKELKKSSTMSFVNRKDMDLSMKKMSDKFNFHGFPVQAEQLLKVYEKFIENITIEDRTNAFNAIRFLLGMSENPTENFLKNPQDYTPVDNEDEIIDWGKFLLEGIEVYNPNNADSDDFDDFSSITSDSSSETHENSTEKRLSPVIKSSTNLPTTFDFSLNYQELISTVQNSWYNSENFIEKPNSVNREANIGLLWEKYLNDESYGLINWDKISIVSEYKVIREVIWQFFGLHNSFLFYLENNTLKLRRNVSISSVRDVSFKSFVDQFFEYLDLLEYFVSFLKNVQVHAPSQTYICYALSLEKNFLNKVYENLIAIEEKIRKQDETYTLLQFSEELKELFEQLKILKNIHNEVTADFVLTENSALFYSTSLLKNLRISMENSCDKMENDIKLTLYLESLYRYIFLIESWLVQNDFYDSDEEFIVNSTNWKIREEMNKVDSDHFFSLICTEILQISENVRLLYKLKKFDFFLNNKPDGKLYECFMLEFLKKLCQIFNHSSVGFVEEYCSKMGNINTDLNVVQIIKQPANFENLSDEGNGFFVEVFADFFCDNVKTIENNPTLFETISRITNGIFSLRRLVDEILFEILRGRFSTSGLMMKNALLIDNKLNKMFDLLSSLYFFNENSSILPFYERFFENLQVFVKNQWKFLQFTASLGEIVSDTYPGVKCRVEILAANDICKDSLSFCERFEIKTNLDWPLNIVIQNDGEELRIYKKIFKMLIRLKWGRFVLKNLSCKDIKMRKSRKKLEVLRFSLIHFVNFLYNFSTCFCLMRNRKKFELELEKSHDLNTICVAHRNFVEGIEEMLGFLCEDLENPMNCIKTLCVIWTSSNVERIDKILNETHELYRISRISIENKINKIYLVNC